MNKRNALIMVTILAISAAAAAAGEQAEGVRIYLPRSRVVSSPKITLEDIAYISSQDMDLAENVRAVTLGRAPFPGEKITLSRRVILSRLATSGIYPPDIRITGANDVHIRRDSSTVAAEDFIHAAEAFVKSRFSNEGVSWRLARKPAELNIAGQVKVDLLCSEAKSSAGEQFRVVVSVIGKASGKEIGKRELLFKLKYHSQRAVAISDIAPGQVVTADNTRVEAIVVDRKPAEFGLPFGLKAIKRIQRGAVILAGMVVRPKPAVLVKRNRTVRIKVIGPAWQITTLGVALQNGRFGDAIRVRNIDSKRIIVARVDKHGDVVPVMATH